VTATFRRAQGPPGVPKSVMLRPRVREAGDAALLIELPARIDPMTNAAVLRLAEIVHAAGLKGVRDVVPAIRSLAVFYDPLHADVESLRALFAGRSLEPDMASEGRRHEVPVVYGGDAGLDLEEIASASGISPEELIARHSGRDYRVYMLGFLPGFAYLGTLDPSIVAPRRSVPRLKVPAGAVGVAGRQTGIYPRECPGGWALLGRTSLKMFDADSRTPARFAPGDRVRFVPVASVDLAADGLDYAGSEDPAHVRHDAGSKDPAYVPQAQGARSKDPACVLEIRRGGLMTTVQDSGRWGHQRDGVSVSGAMDRVAHRVANALVGNESTAATLEVTMIGPEVICLRDVVIAVTGADLSPRVGQQPVPLDQAVPLAAGSVLSFGLRRQGARAYVAFAGGIDVPVVLGSRATHTPSDLGGLGGRPLRAGDRLVLRQRGPLPSRRVSGPVTRLMAGGARVRILPGPQVESFPSDALASLTQSRFVVSTESNRMGYRLKGSSVPVPAGEMISDVTFPGAVQVPPSGEPILLMADRQTAGGYAQLAIVISADMPLAGQLAPGDWVQFELTTRSEAIAALVEQERALQHLEGHAFA